MESAVWNLIRRTKHLMWMNMLFFVLLVIMTLFAMGDLDVEDAIFVLLFGMFMAGGGQLLFSRFFMNNAREEVIVTYEKIKESIYIDELTGIYNRRAGMTRLHEEFTRSRRAGASMSVAVVDIDNFKSINDTYGHQVGDQVIRTVAQIIRDELRESDIVFRYGGEEFVIILAEMDERRSLYPLDRLRERLSRETINCGRHGIVSTISIGVAHVHPSDETVEEVIHRADAALYSAKRNGRNRVERSEALQNR